jgi:hypothetical protein
LSLKNPIAFWISIVALAVLVGGGIWAVVHFAGGGSNEPAPPPVVEEVDPPAPCVEQCREELRACLEVICSRMKDGHITPPADRVERYKAATFICIGNSHPNMVACKDCILAQAELFVGMASQMDECQP